MGCGSSRHKNTGLNLPTDCSGNKCDLPTDFLNIDPVFSKREIAQTLLMDYNTYRDYYNTVLNDVLTDRTRPFKYYISNAHNFFNKNGANITNEQVHILYTSYLNSDIIKEHLILCMIFFVSNTSMPRTRVTWYDSYVEMLYNTIMNTPLYSSSQFTAKVVDWLADNPAPDMDGFRDLNNFNNYKSLISVANEIKLQNKKVSGFTNYIPLKNGFINEYHSIK